MKQDKVLITLHRGWAAESGLDTGKNFLRPPTPNKGGDEIEENEMGGACSTCGGRVYRGLMGKLRPLGRTGH